jgi:Xaa-Pro aminopeptidase
MNSFAIARGFAYTPLSPLETMPMCCIIENNQQCKAGDLILLDVAAEYANYSSDMSRTIPVSGRYTKRQKRSVQCRAECQNEATKNADYRNTWKQYHIEVGKLMTSELLGLGLIDKADVQNENPIGLLIKNISCTGHRTWD